MGIWNQDDDWENYIVEMKNGAQSMEQNAYHVAVAKGPRIPWRFYKLKDSCLAPKKPLVAKELDSQYNKVAIGWNGSPAKDGPQYSIFSLLGLMPEGTVTNQQNGRSYHIVHYGGPDINCYLIVLPNPDTKSWDSAIQVSSDKSSAVASIMPIVRNNPRQQWKIFGHDMQTQPFQLQNIATGRLLAINLEPANGAEIFSTQPISTLSTPSTPSTPSTDTTIPHNQLFIFTSSYGESPTI
jgi:hypothetical protein